MHVIGRASSVVAILVAMAAPQAQAQGPIVGFKLGPSFSTLSSDPDQGQENLTAFTGGAFVRFGMGPVSIQPELMYVTKGSSFSFSEGPFKVEGDIRLDYIEVPVLLHVGFAAGSRIGPYVYAGPAFAFEVGCTASARSEGIDFSSNCDEQEEEVERRKLDVGAMVGGGLSLPLGPGAALLEARYNFGLLNLDTAEVDNEKVKNRSAAVLVGYSIPLGRR